MRGSFRAGLPVLVAAIAVLPVIASGLLALQERRLASTPGKEAPLLVEPAARSITDESPIVVAVTVVPGPEVLAGQATGTITAVGVGPGDRIADGSIIFEVDGVGRLGFASAAPFYRAIRPGTEGADVAELHRLLTATGHLSRSPGEQRLASTATGQAIAALARSIGAQPAVVFDPAWVVWLPVTDLSVAGVNIRVGQPAPAQGTVMITTPGTIAAAHIVAAGQEPLRFAPGIEYVAVVDGEGFPVSTSTGQIEQKSMARIREPMPNEREGIPGTVRRKTPLQGFAVPSPAVMTNGTGSLCVWLQDGAHFRAVTVSVAGARGGVTNIGSGLEVGALVLANPARVLEDPRCP